MGSIEHEEGSYWMSSSKMTFGVEVDAQGIITKAAPIARKFEGQSLNNLIRWMRGHGGFKYHHLGIDGPAKEG